ncbi:ribosomal RNA processing Brix domain protein [Actinidia rufa]|uniref:Ribosomal RNA processing Brix domain protein n=1 Tax=Actinidia rufa TaxID=165716 RepID=A0A7J0DSV6_9ERIC|nr:ribosomal RNA processing Brix domain protein [Actinidia rufa]
MKDKQDHDLGGIDALVEDRIRAEATDATQGEEVRNFQKLLNDSQRELYPGSEDYTLLKFVIEAFNIKVTSHWTNKSFNLFLKFQSRLLPKGNLVPKSTYEARKILSDLGLSYELIDACINDCVLFWKENAMLDRCPRCNVSRYKINCDKGKKIPHKILRYFPLTPRLRRLFMSRMISKAMRWHVENPSDGEESRHPTHRLAVDGFNPFGNMSNSYRDKQPGIDIDVYMRPMVDELKELWQTGALTYDAFGREYFRMRAALSWTIHDWPAFGDISGWRTKGHYSCYTCNDEPYFESLRSKTAYINHRCYLPENHLERRKRVAYNGKQEKRKRSLELPVEKIQEQLNNITGVILGKYPTNKKRPRYKPNWTKISILYELPYFKDKKFRHNIDVMHVEKNFSENLIGTMLGIDGKNKDTDKARKDLEDKGIRKELWLTQHPNGSYIKPRASFSLTIEEREAFFEFLKSVKYPDGYAANISREHNNLLHISNGQDITNLQRKHFPKWFKEQINRLRANNSKVANDELWSLANGPNLLVKEYSGCIVNGVRFRTREEDNRRKTQNSGVLAEGDHEGKIHNFYGHLINVWEFEYMCQKKVILFQCEWYNTGNTGRNCTIRTDKYCTSIDVKSRWYQSDPFILPSHAKQVFYLKDTKWGRTLASRAIGPAKGVFDVPEVRDGEPSDLEESSEAFQQESISSTLPIDIEDDIRYHREDVEVEVIERVGPLHETYDEDDEDHEIMGDNINNEVGDDDEVPDADDMDPDMDYDV